MEKNGGEKIIWRERETVNLRAKPQLWWNEAQWEKWFIRKLKDIGWNFRNDLKDEENQTSETKLESRLLKQVQRLYRLKNNLPDSFRFSEREKVQLLLELKSFKSRDLNKPIHLIIPTKKITNHFLISLIDKENIKNNRFWVAQQVKERKSGFAHIYDLVLLVNGIPLVCIELKKATISSTEAFEQLKGYEKDRLMHKPSSIFNNFQLFIAMNFQRIYCLGKKDMLDAINNLEIRNYDRIFLHLLEEQIKEFFRPARILKRIFEEETIYRQDYLSRAREIRPERRTYRSYNTKATNDTNPSRHFEPLSRHIKSPEEKLMTKIIVFFATSSSLLFFLLINFLSGWALWTILLGMPILCIGIGGMSILL